MVTKNKNSIVFVILFLVFSCFILNNSILNNPTSAVRIKRSQISKAAIFKSVYSGKPSGAATQGGVVTKNFLVFSDCKGNGSASCRDGYLRVIKRNNCSQVKKIKTGVSSVRGLYHKWGSDVISVINKGGGLSGCLSISGTPSFSSSGGCSMPPGVYYYAGGTSQGVAASYNGYNFKVAGYGSSRTYLLLSGNGVRREYTIENKDIRALSGIKDNYGYEPEGVSVDGDTGEVYISYAAKINGSRRILFFKIASSVFKNYTGKNGKSTFPVCNNTKPSISSTDKKNTSSSKKDNPSGGGSNNSGNTTPSKTFTPSQSTYDGVAETIFFGNIKDDGSGCGIFMILNFIIEILTWGIGVAGVIGISISGIMYLTARGNEAQTLKAKRRIYEIVIGLAAYAVIWAVTNWLLPGGVLNNSPTCATISNEDLQKQRAARQAEIQKQQAEAQKTNNNQTNSKNNTTIPGADYKNATKTGKKVLEAAEWSARYMAKNKFIYFQYDPSNGYSSRKIRSGYGPKGGVWPDIWPRNWAQAKEWRMTHCSGFAVLVLKKTGLFNNMKIKVFSANGKMTSYFWHNKKAEATFNKYFVKRKGNGETISSLAKKKKLGPGDIFGTSSTGAVHTMIYAGKVKGKHYIYEVSAPVNKILTYGLGKTTRYRGYLHPVISGSTRVGEFFHAK